MESTLNFVQKTQGNLNFMYFIFTGGMVFWTISSPNFWVFKLRKAKKRFIKKLKVVWKKLSIWLKNSAPQSQVTQFDSKNSLNKQA